MNNVSVTVNPRDLKNSELKLVAKNETKPLGKTETPQVKPLKALEHIYANSWAQ
ncbi:uncharacterized protein PGTG_21186 [Puccinia graminis f. sp. tritici CRL 75-36-700-3]|uniref:Uncharacterized protein n=1 Tax=Puccinia graminis f. sp. tritici (strain CRL 75-36-700-3 / race SCCL) TaxID=418459 RepID=H6QQH8_PUCGT|nr:uncharacterized protein PGTG_21186 [Puccinia graminis f. sp. tritici CRL 75-36-700-3]EHS62678.1 hypothetical protein PGTG_21186 [Puccinia graminis f. sp. tritici CRL 75-36-700-3]